MFIFSNLATSLDGKIATTSKVHFPLGTKEDLAQMMVLRRRSDAILMGASTLRAYKKALFVSKADRQSLNVIMSGSLDGVDPTWPFFTDQRVKRLIFVGHRCDPKRIEALQASSEVIRLEDPKASQGLALQIVEHLRKRGVQNLLIEGGGSVMWDFAEHDLIDEYNVTLTPRILGGTESPTLVDGRGFEPSEVVNLKLKECRQVGDELYLVYTKTGRRG